MKNVLQILLAYSITLSTESASFTVFNNNDNSTTFECGTNLTLRCHMDKASNVLRWQIDYLVGASTNAAANCFSSPCQVFDNFGRRYSYSLNALAQISDLNISPVDSTDNRRQYRCDDFISPSIFVATVKVPPKNETMHMSINNDTIKVTTGCIFNAGNLTYYWYKRKENETNGQMIQSSQPDISDEYCACMNNCTGYCWKSSYTVDVYGLGKAGETYEIYCVIETTDTDVNGPVIVIANQTFTAKAPVTTRMSTTSTTRRTTSFITESTDSLTEGGIAGIVIGVIVLALIIIGVVLLIRHKRSKVDDILETPKEFQIKEINETSATFTCLSGNSKSKHTITLCCFPVDVDGNNRHLKTEVLNVFSGETLTLTIEGLRPKCQYKCYVYAVNVNGKMSDKSKEIIIRTKVPLPLVTKLKKNEHPKPSLVNIKEVEDRSFLTANSAGDEYSQPWLANFREDKKRRTETSITLTWSDITESNGIFFIHFRRTRNVKEKWETLKVESQSECTLKNLKPGSSYTIKLSSQNHDGLSLETKPIRIKTKVAIPVAPINFKCKSVTEENVTLTWVPGNELPNQRFGLSFSTSEEAYRPIWVSYSGEERVVYTVGDLMPGTTYMFEIVSLIGERTSDTSKVIQVTTKGIPREEEQHANTRTSKFSINNLH